MRKRLGLKGERGASLLTATLTFSALLFSPASPAQSFVGVSVNIGPLTVHCHDAMGSLVKNYSAPMGQAAMSTVIGGWPAIIVSPGHIATQPVQFAVFTYAHECAHHSLGHIATMGMIPSHAMEYAADCRAAIDVKNAGWLPAPDFNVAMSVLYAFPGSPTHPPGPARVAHAWNCFNNA
jgi:hypothetical protein